jgi:type VI secretion system protein ImpF
MTDPQSRTFVAPCLLDRLTLDPSEGYDQGRGSAGMSPVKYRQAVLRDLQYLLNSKAHPVGDDIGAFKEISGSVYNYGMRDVCGLTISEFRASEVETEVLRAIRCFEQRIDGDSLTVDVESSGTEGGRMMISIEIKGKLWVQSSREDFPVHLEMDIETGHYAVRDRVNG